MRLSHFFLSAIDIFRSSSIVVFLGKLKNMRACLKRKRTFGYIPEGINSCEFPLGLSTNLGIGRFAVDLIVLMAF